MQLCVLMSKGSTIGHHTRMLGVPSGWLSCHTTCPEIVGRQAHTVLEDASQSNDFLNA
jgi:hypothetical protein